MPLLHAQLSGQAQQKRPDGKTVPVALPPAVGLVQVGPRIQASISIADQVATQLIQQGKQIKPPVSGWALIDTGASISCIDDEAAKALELPIIDVQKMSSASHASHDANIYPIRIQLAGLPMAINAPRAMGAALKTQGLVALIGRDVLYKCLLIYNGPSGEFTLAL